MIDLKSLERQTLKTDPYEWAFVDGLFTPSDAEALSATYPRDHFKTLAGYDGEKGYEYEGRSLLGRCPALASLSRRDDEIHRTRSHPRAG